MNGYDSFKKVYNFYSSGLTYKEIEKLIKRDVPEVYHFYKKRMRRPVTRNSSVTDRFVFVKDFFVEFLLQLSPVRRLLYSAGIFLFLFAYFAASWLHAVIGFILINLLLAFELADKITAKDELSVARDIQNSLMPKAAPAIPGCEVSCFSEAAQVVGGDFFDFIETNHPSKNYFMIIGDISGKGMAAAIQMVQVHTVLHNVIHQYSTPAKILIELNTRLERILKRGSFLTASILSVSPEGVVKLARAGHLPLIHYSIADNKCFDIIPKGIGIGIGSNGLFDQSTEETELKVSSGDILMLYTDGITEARNTYNEEFGDNNLKYLLCKNAAKSPKEIQEIIIRTVESFTGNAGIQDDITLIIMRIL